MAASLQSLLLALDSKGVVLRLNAAARRSSTGSSWALEHQVLRRRMRMERAKRIHLRSRRPVISPKRKAHLEGSRKPTNCIERRVRSLQRLVPNGESMGLDGLFRKTADYIACLQMQVKVMQVMVKVLSGDSDE